MRACLQSVVGKHALDHLARYRQVGLGNRLRIDVVGELAHKGLDFLEAGGCKSHGGLVYSRGCVLLSSCSAAVTLCRTLGQSPGRGWRNKRAVGYQGLSSR